MDKNEILKRSQEENKGKPDERERIAIGIAARVSMITGIIICTALNIIFDTFEITFAVHSVFLAMLGSYNVVIAKYYNKRSNLVCGILGIIAAVLCFVPLIYLCKIR